MSDVELDELCDDMNDLPSPTDNIDARDANITAENESSVHPIPTDTAGDSGRKENTVIVDDVISKENPDEAITANKESNEDNSKSETTEKSVDASNESSSRTNDCCIWKSCKECDKLKTEKTVLESKHKVETDALQFRLDATLKDLVALQEEKAIKESTNDEFVKSLEDAIDERNKVIYVMKTEHLKDMDELKNIQTDNGDLNIKRVNKMYADLKKEKLKAEENYKKDNDQLKKQKTNLEAEVFTACKDNKNKDDERKTLLKFFDGMNELLGRLNLPTLNSNEEERSKKELEFSCDKCEFKSADSISFNLHKLKKHNPPIYHTCEVCKNEFRDKNSLTNHMQTHKKKQKCNQCLYMADSQDELDNHVLRRHSKEYECDLCDFVSQSKNGILQHEKDDHNIKKTRKKFNCIKCDETFVALSDCETHMETSHATNKSNRGFHRRTFSAEERRRNGFCCFWNQSECSFGESCRFLHQEAPYCRFQERCRDKQSCRFFHEEFSKASSSPSAPFLGTGFPPPQARWKGRQHNQQH